MYKRITLFAALASMLLLSAAAFGQGTTGNISGTVTDPNGAVVPGATVKVTNTATNQSRESSAGSDGMFAFQALPAAKFGRVRNVGLSSG